MTGAADSLFNFLISYTEFAVTDLYIERFEVFSIY